MRADRVLVLDGHTNQSLACVRSLGRGGYAVFVASHRRRPLAAWSRHCRGRFQLAGETREAFAAMRAWAIHQGIATVLPISERACVLMNAQRAAWETAGIVVGCGPDDMLLRAFDKAQTLRIAAATGVSIPLTRAPRSLAECRAAASDIGFPCVVKSRFSNVWDGARFLPSRGTSYVNDAAALEAVVLAYQQGEQWPLIQQLVPGRGKGVFTLCDHGRPVAWFAHERLRDVRPSGSGSSLRRSTPLDARLREPAERLLNALQWHGPAMVEFRDDEVHAPALMEVNGRFWGSLQLAITAGVDFPLLWMAILTDQPVEPLRQYAAGVTVRWLWGDFKRLLHILAGRPPGYSGVYPTRWAGVREFLGPQPHGTRLEIWDRSDPWPAVGEWVEGARDLLNLSVHRRQPAGRAGPPAVGRAAVANPAKRRGTAMEAPIRVLMITTGWPQPGQQIQTTHFIKRQAEFLRAAGVVVDVFYFRGRGSLWNYARAWVRVRARLRHGSYDLVHAQWAHSGLMALPKQVPLVVTCRSGDLHGIVDRSGRQTPLGRALQWLCRIVTRRADAVILVSAHMKRFLDPSVPVHVIPSGLDLDLFRIIPRDEARRHLGLPPDRQLVLFAGDPESPRKRGVLARQAVALLNRSLPAELVVAWAVPHTDMPYYMNACDALVFTSRQEGSPNVVKEALACDLPIVSVSVGDVPLRIIGVEGCELCADDRPATLAAALERVLRRGGRAAGRAAVQDLDERLTTQQVIAIYRSVLGRPTPAPAAPSPADSRTSVAAAPLAR